MNPLLLKEQVLDCCNGAGGLCDKQILRGISSDIHELEIWRASSLRSLLDRLIGYLTLTYETAISLTWHALHVNARVVCTAKSKVYSRSPELRK